MREVAVIGVGMTQFGEIWDKSFRELGIQAGFEAIVDASITSKDIDALYIGNMSAGRLIRQEHIAPMITENVGLASRNIPAVRIESASASGGIAFRHGYLAVASGLHEIVVVGGAEKVSDALSSEIVEILASAADQEWEAFFGVTMPALYAMIARRHMHNYGTTLEQLAAVAVKNHEHGSLNPKAQFRTKITIDAVLKSPMVADPLTVLHCAPISDGAAAVVLCPLERAREFTDTPVKIIGSGHATDTLALHNRASITEMRATRMAGRQAFVQAKKTQRDIDVIEVHDSYTIGEILALEDLGFFKKGEAGSATEEGRTTLQGDLPTNTSGGLKAQGHPYGATGVAQVVEIVLQLRGKAGKRQVKDAKVGLTHNVGGAGGSAVVHIFEAV
jgi:acetyl-CoA C-acetyltransferase